MIRQYCISLTLNPACRQAGRREPETLNLNSNEISTIKKVIRLSRDVAQSGRAQRSGRWGRWFKSSRPDHNIASIGSVCLTLDDFSLDLSGNLDFQLL